ncbi:MAG: response regulator [bacterium]
MSNRTFNSTVMMIDDEPDNLTVLNDILQVAGYHTVAFTSGKAALAAAMANPPDIVLLDVRMPVLDGLTVCRRFKCERVLAGIPVIFVSALYNSADILAAFDAGGVDYVTKPFQAVEVLARINAHLQLRQLQQQVDNQNQHLECVVAERTVALTDAYLKLEQWDVTKDVFLNLISHELRTPMVGVLTIADLLVDEIPPDSPLQEYVEVYTHGRAIIMQLIENAELFSQIHLKPDSWKHVPVALQPVLENAVCEAQLMHAPAVLAPADPAMADRSVCVCSEIVCEEGLLQRALANLIWTAFCCTAKDDPVQMGVETQGESVRIIFRVSSPPLPAAAIETFFDVCGQRVLRRAAGDFGLSPALSRRILLLFDGEVIVRNAGDDHVEIVVILPQARR